MTASRYLTLQTLTNIIAKASITDDNRHASELNECKWHRHLRVRQQYLRGSRLRHFDDGVQIIRIDTTTPDSTIPVITLTGENPQTIELGDVYIELGATTDDGSAVTINDLAFANAVGTYLIYYDSTDSEGNHAVQVTRTVNVVDSTIPVITLTENPQTIELGDTSSLAQLLMMVLM